jgi:hypothetical protein
MVSFAKLLRISQEIRKKYKNIGLEKFQSLIKFVCLIFNIQMCISFHGYCPKDSTFRLLLDDNLHFYSHSNCRNLFSNPHFIQKALSFHNYSHILNKYFILFG